MKLPDTGTSVTVDNKAALVVYRTAICPDFDSVNNCKYIRRYLRPRQNIDRHARVAICNVNARSVGIGRGGTASDGLACGGGVVIAHRPSQRRLQQQAQRDKSDAESGTWQSRAVYKCYRSGGGQVYLLIP
jgi:hypothetical protein